MLFLQPPFHIIEGVAVFRDHANERQFYYLPAMPKLTTIFDPGVGQPIPQLQLLEFRGGAGNGGFLTFEVNLGIDQDKLDTMAMELKRLHQLRDAPILAPVVVESGTVRLLILGKETPPANSPPGSGPGATSPGGGNGAEPDRFVVKINQATEPALYGDNQAIFSVELDQEGVQLVEASLQGELMPIGIVYSLDFLALRPAFTVTVTADWNRVQTHFDESFSVDVLFSSTQIETVIDKLIEDRAIQINVDSFLPEGEDAGSWVGRRDQAVNDFKDMVIHSFFQPSIEPMKEEEDGWDKFTNTAERLSLIGATGGWGGIAKFSYTRRDWTRIDQKSINLKMNERVTVRRSIYPQATLKGLGRLLRDAQGQVDLSRFVRQVTLDSDWFRKRVVTAHGLVNFEYDDVESVTATLTYGTRPQTVRLTSAEPSAARDWNSILINNAMERNVEIGYRVSFKNVDTSERPGVLESPKLTIAGDEFEINPRGEQLYFIDDIVFGAGLLPWDRYLSVLVEVRYEDRPNGIRLAESFLLSKAQPEVKWKRFRLNAQRSEYDVRITYFGADHHDIVADWTTSDQERTVIKDPRPLPRTVTVVPAVTWGLVVMVLVELRYVDESNRVNQTQTLSFFNTEQDRLPKTFAVNLVDPDQRLVQYAATILLSDNRVISIPPSATGGTSIFIRSDMLGHRIVVVEPANDNFVARGIARLEADLAYADPVAGLSAQDHFSFQSPNDRQLFEFDYTVAENGSYTCQMRTVFANGLVQERDLGSLKGDKVVLPTV